MEKERFHWTFWIGVGFIIASLVSFAIIFGGEGPPSLIEELFGYSVSWTIVGIVLIAFAFLKRISKK